MESIADYAAARSRRDLILHAANEPVDLPRAALAIAREEYPQLDADSYVARLDSLGAQLKATIPPGTSTEQRIGRLNSFLFHEQGFFGNRDDYGDARNSFLNEVLDRKCGIPITLSVVYLEIGRRCGIAIDGVAFPGHFLCKVELGGGALVLDPFARGMVLGKDELLRRFRAVAGAGLPFDPRVLQAARPREILVRMLNNLLQIHRQAGDLPRALSAVDRMLLLEPASAAALRDRAGLCEKLGGAAAAADDLERALMLEPASPDADELRGRIERLRGARPLLN